MHPVLILLGFTVMVLVIPYSVWLGFFVEYGKYQSVVVQIQGYHVEEGSDGYRGLVSVCDLHSNCGDLLVKNNWYYSKLDLERYLEEHYTPNSTMICFQYTKKPTLLSIDSRSITEIPMMLSLLLSSILLVIWFIVGLYYLANLQLRFPKYQPISS